MGGRSVLSYFSTLRGRGSKKDVKSPKANPKPKLGMKSPDKGSRKRAGKAKLKGAAVAVGAAAAARARRESQGAAGQPPPFALPPRRSAW